MKGSRFSEGQIIGIRLMLKKLLTEAKLDNAVLKDLLSKIWPRPQQNEMLCSTYGGAIWVTATWS